LVYPVGYELDAREIAAWFPAVRTRDMGVNLTIHPVL
jgi:hypothetical protein